MSKGLPYVFHWRQLPTLEGKHLSLLLDLGPYSPRPCLSKPSRCLSTISVPLVPEEIAVPRFRNSLKGIVADSLNYASGGNEEELERQLDWNCLASLSSLQACKLAQCQGRHC